MGFYVLFGDWYLVQEAPQKLKINSTVMIIVSILKSMLHAFGVEWWVSRFSV